jgi:AbrB family looped-hinge helix DNA binding protein
MEVCVTNVLVKVQKNKNITLPTAVMARFHLSAGDFVQLQETKNGVLLRPAKLVDPSQSYFWTKEWQAGEREAQEDIRHGRVKAFPSVKALMKDLQR